MTFAVIRTADRRSHIYCINIVPSSLDIWFQLPVNLHRCKKWLVKSPIAYSMLKITYNRGLHALADQLCRRPSSGPRRLLCQLTTNTVSECLVEHIPDIGSCQAMPPRPELGLWQLCPYKLWAYILWYFWHNQELDAMSLNIKKMLFAVPAFGSRSLEKWAMFSMKKSPNCNVICSRLYFKSTLSTWWHNVHIVITAVIFNPA